MTFQELNEGDLFVLADEVGSDCYRKANPSQATHVLYMTVNGWLPYARGQMEYVNADTLVQRKSIVLSNN